METVGFAVISKIMENQFGVFSGSYDAERLSQSLRSWSLCESKVVMSSGFFISLQYFTDKKIFQRNHLEFQGKNTFFFFQRPSLDSSKIKNVDN